jgi:GT2 family glycosyltransferase
MSVPPLPRRFATASPRPLVTVPFHGRPAVSFVTVTFGTGPIIVDSLISLVESLESAHVPYDYLVVDNAHPEATRSTVDALLLATHGVSVVRSPTNLGFGGGCEVGVGESTGEVIGFVNPDVIFERGWLEPLLAQLERPGVSIAAPVLLDPDGTVQEAGQRLWADGTTSPITSAPAPGDVATPDYASAACWMVRRAEHERIGGFDPAFFPAYYEDVDYGLRAASKGGSTVVVGSSQVTHHKGSSTSDARIPDTTPQRHLLLERWPELATTQPAPPSSRSS